MTSARPTSDLGPDRASVRRVLDAARAGEKWALSRLYGQHAPDLLRYLQVRTGSDAAELSARVWIAVALEMRSIAHPEELRPAILHAADEELSRARGASEFWDTAPLVTKLLRRVELDGDGAAYDATAVAGDAAAGKLRAALSDEELDVVLLDAVLGYTAEEIALVRHIPLARVQHVETRAQASLERAFGPNGYLSVLERVAHTTVTRPPVGLLDAMAIALADEQPRRRSIRPTRALVAKAAVVGAVVLTSASGAAAAATGTLPDPVQDRVAVIAGAVGLELPDRSGGGAPPAEQPPVPQPAPGSTPSPRADHGSTVSSEARETDLEGVEKGRHVSDTARAGNGPAEGPPQTGRPAEPPAAPPGPPAEAPERGGPSEGAPGRASASSARGR